ncbi:MAG: ABC transporter substrate-binding protein [Cyclobacteriaceae bacterium]|nr:ABC transporter substrate-binding protein [Cyclobacteriaceae bacterium]MDX5466947.1 ABC transporter substrate-binding protein [Cyclobacteriaceae bacterium]
MKTFRIVGVPEHFNYPFRILCQNQPFEKDGIRLEWKEESRGSGQMALDLKNGQADMAILLTESFLKEFESNPTVKMAGFHVASPLTWGVHVNPSHLANQVENVESRHFLVSRMGSGSHLMALVLADTHGWNKDSLSFELVGNLEGAKMAFATGNPGIFLWEKYTTAPEVGIGTMKRIGEVQSPWPCFVLVVNERSIQEFSAWIGKIRDEVYAISAQLKSDLKLPSRLSEAYGLEESAINSWLNQTQWATQGKIDRRELAEILSQTLRYGIITRNLNPEDFLMLSCVEISG